MFGWWARSQELRVARHQTRLATETAKQELSAYRAKQAIEWELRWASPLDKTYRDEIITVVWSLPIIGLFIPFLRDTVTEGFLFLGSLDPNAPALYIYGWAIIFVTTFGIKNVKTLLMPGRLAGLVETLGKVPDTVPAKAVNAAQDAVSQTQQEKS